MNEGSHERERVFEIYPDRGVYTGTRRSRSPTVAFPLDDGSFLFFIRSIPLEVGKEYSFDRYFRPDRNPVRIMVLRKGDDQCSGRKSSRRSSSARSVEGARRFLGGRTRREKVWLTDDSLRLMVQLKTHMKLGSLSLFLRSYSPAKALGDSTTVAKD